MLNRALGLSLLTIATCAWGCSKSNPADVATAPPAAVPAPAAAATPAAAPAASATSTDGIVVPAAAPPAASVTSTDAIVGPPAAAPSEETTVAEPAAEPDKPAEPAKPAAPVVVKPAGPISTGPPEESNTVKEPEPAKEPEAGAEKPPAAEPDDPKPADKPEDTKPKKAEPPAVLEGNDGISSLGTNPGGKEGSPEAVLQQFVVDLAADNFDALTPVIGKKAAGMIKQIKEGKLSDEDKATMKEALAKVRLAGPPKTINGGILVVLETEDGSKVQFTLAKENGKVVINDMKLPKNMPKKKTAEAQENGPKVKS